MLRYIKLPVIRRRASVLSLAASAPHCILHAHFMFRHLFKPKGRISSDDSRHFELPWLFRSPHSNKLECPEAPLSFYPGFSSLGLRPRCRASLIYGDGEEKKCRKHILESIIRQVDACPFIQPLRFFFFFPPKPRALTLRLKLSRAIWRLFNYSH